MGACFEVYKRKGCGFTEPIYQECLEIELDLQRIPFVAQKSIALEYRAVRLNSGFSPILSVTTKSSLKSRPSPR